MNPSTPLAPFSRLALAFTVAGSLAVSSCSMTTSADPHAGAVHSADVPGSSLDDAVNLEPPVMVQLPEDVDPPADPMDPSAVAQAFVITVTNRLPNETAGSWRRRWSKWTTQTLAMSFGTDRGLDGYRRAVEARGGVSVGSVVGLAVRDCGVDHCSVDVVADETLVLDGRVLEESNFVTWRLELRRDPDGWFVDGVGFGAGS
jgi:hypothetical protein